MSKRRMQKLVDFEVQSSLLVRLVIHWLLFLIVNVVGVVFWIRLVEQPTDDWSTVWTAAMQRLLPFALISLALLPVFIWDSLKLSNRFAGPILRVRRALSRLANGETPELIEFRQSDFWKSLALDLNRAFVHQTERTHIGPETESQPKR